MVRPKWCKLFVEEFGEKFFVGQKMPVVIDRGWSVGILILLLKGNYGPKLVSEMKTLSSEGEAENPTGEGPSSIEETTGDKTDKEGNAFFHEGVLDPRVT